MNPATLFRCLTYLAILLLWGISLLNGTVKALILAVWKGQLNDGDALETNYTGFPFLDYPVSLLVAFFFYGTNGYDEGYQLFLLDAYSALQPAFIWLYVETLRPGDKPMWIRRPVIFGLLWQCFGGAISLPLFFAVHVDWTAQTKIARATRLEQARVLPFSFLAGVVFPTVVGMGLTWLGPGARTARHQQLILAAWQPSPIWMSWMLQTGVYVGTWLFGRGVNPLRDRRKAHQWVLASYSLAAVFSALGHCYVVFRIINSACESTNFVRMYVPFAFAGPAGTEGNILARGSWLFLQYDLIIISLSSLMWVTLRPYSFPWDQRVSGGILGLVVLTGNVMLGPGATVSLVLLARESILAEYLEAKNG